MSEPGPDGLVLAIIGIGFVAAFAAALLVVDAVHRRLEAQERKRDAERQRLEQAFKKGK